MFHLAQLGQIGLPLLVGLLLELNASLLVLMLLAALVHTLTAWWDIVYSERRRRITPFEQLVHGFLIVIPVVGTALVIAQHWVTFSAIWNTTSSDWSLRWKLDPISAALSRGGAAARGGVRGDSRGGRIHTVLARRTEDTVTATPGRRFQRLGRNSFASRAARRRRRARGTVLHQQDDGR